MYNGQQGIQDEHKGEWLEQERVGSHQSPRDRTRRMGGPGRGLEGEERGGAGHRRGYTKMVPVLLRKPLSYKVNIY